MSYLLFFIFLLLPLTDLKILGVKIYEIFYLLIIAISIIFCGKKISINKYYKKYLLMLISFITLVLLISINSFFGEFYNPANVTSLLNKPIIITFARITQIVLAVYIPFFIYQNISQNKQYFLKGMHYYLIVGGFVCAFGLISLIGNFALGEDLLFGSYDGRIRATFNEGGPFGIYVVSLILMTNLYFSLIQRSMMLKMFFWGIFGTCLILSWSKAAILLLIVLCISSLFISRKSKLTILCTISALVLGAFGLIGNGLQGYYNDYLNAEQLLINGREEDPNFVMGRIAAAYIIPNMIVDNPFIGIGLGNYPLMRNKPEYRGEFPAVEDWDLTGFGLLDVFVEVGIPVALLFTVALSLPFYFCFKFKLNKNISRIALFQLLAHCLGVQITFIYPWMITVFVFAYLKLYPADTNKELKGEYCSD